MRLHRDVRDVSRRAVTQGGISMSDLLNRDADMLSHEIVVKGNCTACGKPLGENDGLFLCAECQKKNNDQMIDDSARAFVDAKRTEPSKEE